MRRSLPAGVGVDVVEHEALELDELPLRYLHRDVVNPPLDFLEAGGLGRRARVRPEPDRPVDGPGLEGVPVDSPLLAPPRQREEGVVQPPVDRGACVALATARRRVRSLRGILVFVVAVAAAQPPPFARPLLEERPRTPPPVLAEPRVPVELLLEVVEEHLEVRVVLPVGVDEYADGLEVAVLVQVVLLHLGVVLLPAYPVLGTDLEVDVEEVLYPRVLPVPGEVAAGGLGPIPLGPPLLVREPELVVVDERRGLGEVVVDEAVLSPPGPGLVELLALRVRLADVPRALPPPAPALVAPPARLEPAELVVVPVVLGLAPRLRPPDAPHVVVEEPPPGVGGHHRVLPPGVHRRARRRLVGPPSPGHGGAVPGVVREGHDEGRPPSVGGRVRRAVHDAVVRVAPHREDERPGQVRVEVPADVDLVVSAGRHAPRPLELGPRGRVVDRPDDAHGVPPLRPVRDRVPGRGRPVELPVGVRLDGPPEPRVGDGVQPEDRADDLAGTVPFGPVAVETLEVEPHERHPLGHAVDA
mmetsp:Transcript_32104/g.76730  ORF Transcript_32104/g.76730 Transcript_32104/m.76730 type:complete len:528 (+) Transcript_32104:1857-3440(+)